MTSWFEISALIAVIAGAAYWLDGMRAKELARAAGRRACDDAGAQFLDDTVVLTAVRLRRLPSGTLSLWRRYKFEFSVYQSIRQYGEVIVWGNRVTQVDLESNRTKQLH